MTVTNENHVPEGIKSRLNLRNYLLLFGSECFVFPSAVEEHED